MVIYCVQNLVTGKKYIGQHKFCSSNEEFQRSNYWGSGIRISNSIKKHGIDNFRKWVLIHCKDNEANKYEALYVKKLNTLSPDGYNLVAGGLQGPFSEETRRKIGESSKNRKFPPRSIESRKKISIANSGKKRSAQTIEKLKQRPKQTFFHEEEYKKKLREAQAKYHREHPESNQLMSEKIKLSWIKRRLEGKTNSTSGPKGPHDSKIKRTMSGEQKIQRSTMMKEYYKLNPKVKGLSRPPKGPMIEETKQKIKKSNTKYWGDSENKKKHSELLKAIHFINKNKEAQVA